MVRRKARGPAADGMLPGYADLEEIGGGAFATVYRAVEAETGRTVALKILKVDTVHSHLIETFQQEIQALAAVSDHPNIVTLYRPSTTTDGRPVLVLELCRESLKQRLRTSGPLTSREVTAVGVKIAGALETAHRNGFLHRDMKPQNILVTQFGEPALADFGVAALQASAQMTAGVFGFTTLHAAPEMLEGHHLSPATDVYGLASTMYQLLTGQAPFATFENEAPASVILRILRDPVRPLRAEHIPLDLADLLESALSKEPEGRPRTAADFAQALQAVELGQGWPETVFVAWGEEGVAPRPAEASEARGPMGVTLAEPAAGPPTSSSRSLPPLLPPAGPRAMEAAGPGAMEAAGPPPSPSGPPPAPLSPVRPSLVAPEASVRKVVQPVNAVRGRMGPPPAPAPPLSPQPLPAPAAGRADRADRGADRTEPPAYVDPDPSEGPVERSVYEETMGVAQLFEADHRRAGSAPAAGRRSPAGTPAAGRRSPRGTPAAGRRSPRGTPAAGRGSLVPTGSSPPPSVPLWAVASFVVAVLVIVAAALIVGGVI